ncbi:MAG: pitrilysin family protein [Bacteroidales bacterium]
MYFFTHTFSNGLKIIHLPSESDVAHCGLIINAGSRDEKDGEQGIAHFIEHLIFKGTKKRKAFHVLSRMDDIGGEINAYTSKEETCIHTSFIKEEYQRALELLSDIITNSTFPLQEMDKERNVIIDEINSYLDNPAEAIYDDFEELVFKNQPLGNNILGNPANLRKFTKDDIEEFIAKNYIPNHMVIGSVGKIKFSKLIHFVEKYFGGLRTAYNESSRVRFLGYTPAQHTANKNTNQVHCMIGNITYDMYHPENYTMALLDNLIGGPGLNNRLNMLLREKLGYVYHVESNYSAFTDVGLFSVYFGTEPKKLDKTLQQVMKEFKNLREKKLGAIQLSKAKKQLYGQIAINAENKSALMLSASKNYLMKNQIDSLQDIYRKIEQISANDILATANKVLEPDNLSLLIYK